MAAAAPLPTLRAVSPLKEMGAYEALWAKPDTTFESLAKTFREKPDALPSDLVQKRPCRRCDGYGFSSSNSSPKPRRLCSMAQTSHDPGVTSSFMFFSSAV
jgi:hypothetical protein